MVVETFDRDGSLYVRDKNGLEVYLGARPTQELQEFIPRTSVKEKVKIFIELKDAGFTADEIQELTREM